MVKNALIEKNSLSYNTFQIIVVEIKKTQKTWHLKLIERVSESQETGVKENIMLPSGTLLNNKTGKNQAELWM